MDDNSEYSGDDINIEDGIKLVKALVMEVNKIEHDEQSIEAGLRICTELLQAKLEHSPGEVRALECQWSSLESLVYDCYRMYVGVGEEMDLEKGSKKLHHCHRVEDMDGDEYWNPILAYLHLNRVPSSPIKAEKLCRWLQRFFLMNGTLWRKNGTKPLLLVVLSKEVQLRIIRGTHNESGHCRRDPTYRKVHDTVVIGGLTNMFLLQIIVDHAMSVK